MVPWYGQERTKSHALHVAKIAMIAEAAKGCGADSTLRSVR